MYPKSKSALIRWAKDNIGKEVNVRAYERFIESGKVLANMLVWDVTRVIKHVQSNAIVFETKEGESSWLFTDQKEDEWEFGEGWFTNSNGFLRSDGIYNEFRLLYTYELKS